MKIRGVAIIEQVKQFGGRRRCVQGDDNSTQLDAGKIAVNKLRDVRQHESDRVAFLDSSGLQGLCNALNSRIQLLVCNAAIIRDQDRPVGIAFDGIFQ